MTDKEEKAAPGLVGLDFLNAIRIEKADKDGWRYIYAGENCIGWIVMPKRGDGFMAIFTAEGQIKAVSVQ